MNRSAPIAEPVRIPFPALNPPRLQLHPSWQRQFASIGALVLCSFRLAGGDFRAPESVFADTLPLGGLRTPFCWNKSWK
jgi:hypothetical protein